MSDKDGLSARDSMVLTLYAYWNSRRAGRCMPRRADIDPGDFPHHLPNILLIDVRRDARALRFVYRVVGTAEVDARGTNPTGQDVATHYFGPSSEDVLGCYTRVCEERAPLLDAAPWHRPDGRVVQEEILFLPISEDGELVSQILVFAVTRNTLTPAV